MCEENLQSQNEWLLSAHVKQLHNRETGVPPAIYELPTLTAYEQQKVKEAKKERESCTNPKTQRLKDQTKDGQLLIETNSQAEPNDYGEDDWESDSWNGYD